VTLRRAHRLAAPFGGTQRLELDLGTDVLTARTKEFAEAQGMTVSEFAPNNPGPRGGIERPHQTYKRKLRMLLFTSGLPSEQFYYLIEHARRLFNLTMADNDTTKSKQKVYGLSRPPRPFCTASAPR
jgi:transposase InsO family protein